MSINGSPEEKLRWGFRIFDKDGSGLFRVFFGIIICENWIWRFHWAEGNGEDHGVSARTGGCWQGRDCLPLINWHNTPDNYPGNSQGEGHGDIQLPGHQQWRQGGGERVRIRQYEGQGAGGNVKKEGWGQVHQVKPPWRVCRPGWWGVWWWRLTNAELIISADVWLLYHCCDWQSCQSWW